MVKSLRPREALRSLIPALALAVAAGCASNPPRGPADTAPATAQTPAAAAHAPAATPMTYGGDETPMSDAELVQSAEFDTRVLREGFKPEVRNGTTVYCWTDEDIGTRIPTRKCVNRAELEIMLQQRQAQRDAMERTGSGCTPGTNCGN